MTKLNLKKFEKNLVLRTLRSSDWEGVTALERLCFPNMEPWTREQFESQLKLFPEGQIGLEYQGKLVASSASLSTGVRRCSNAAIAAAVSRSASIVTSCPAAQSDRSAAPRNSLSRVSGRRRRRSGTARPGLARAVAAWRR